MLLTGLEKLNVLLPEISNNLHLSVYLRRGAAKRPKLTFPHEKQRTGIIILAVLTESTVLSVILCY